MMLQLKLGSYRQSIKNIPLVKAPRPQSEGLGVRAYLNSVASESHSGLRSLSLTFQRRAALPTRRHTVSSILRLTSLAPSFVGDFSSSTRYTTCISLRTKHSALRTAFVALFFPVNPVPSPVSIHLSKSGTVSADSRAAFIEKLRIYAEKCHSYDFSDPRFMPTSSTKSDR